MFTTISQLTSEFGRLRLIWLVVVCSLATRIVFDERTFLLYVIAATVGLIVVLLLGTFLKTPLLCFTLILLTSIAWVDASVTYNHELDIVAIVLGGLCGALLCALIGNRTARAWLFVPICTLCIWIGGSVFDVLTQGEQLPNDALRFAERRAVDDVAVGLTLSGGGYRAALFHAGVLHQLDEFDVPIQVISAVSGGAIIGSYYAIGGEPQAFLGAVEAGRFNLKRDMAGIHNAVRLLGPLGIPYTSIKLPDFSRLDVQDKLLSRVLFGEASLGDLPVTGGPRLLLGTSDLNQGFLTGLMPDGFLLKSLETSRYFPAQPEEFPSRLSLSQAVALSGAFPGAFPVTEVSIALGFRPLHLALVDGGVIDNLGVELLLEVDRRSATRSGEPGPVRPQGDRDMPAGWGLDIVLMSDAGAILGKTDLRRGDQGYLLRVPDLMSMRSQSLMRYEEKGPPIVKISAADLSPLLVGTFGLNDSEFELVDEEGKKRYFESDDDRCVLDYADLAHPAVFQILEELIPPADPVVRALSDVDQASLIDVLGRTPPISIFDPVGGDAELVQTAFQLRLGVCAALIPLSELFRATDTLKDQFSSHDARGLFNLGRYLVILRARKIEQSLGRTLTAPTVNRRS